MSAPKDRHNYDRDSSSDTEDYHDSEDRRRRVFKNRLRYLSLVFSNIVKAYLKRSPKMWYVGDISKSFIELQYKEITLDYQVTLK
jgi:hypothetical protein